MACSPGHPYIKSLVDNLAASIADPKSNGIVVKQTGPKYCTWMHYHGKLRGEYGDVKVYPPEVFMPYNYTEVNKYGSDLIADDRFGEAAAVHHWNSELYKQGIIKTGATNTEDLTGEDGIITHQCECGNVFTGWGTTHCSQCSGRVVYG